mmetsp:Transcript_81761/g.243833  ORF Transcript_81761/g.243833 Transcript_81761/m.243833 type:complete len:277 (+) Transcript_81761:451-1281(+)
MRWPAGLRGVHAGGLLAVWQRRAEGVQVLSAPDGEDDMVEPTLALPDRGAQVACHLSGVVPKSAAAPGAQHQQTMPVPASHAQHAVSLLPDVIGGLRAPQRRCHDGDPEGPLQELAALACAKDNNVRGVHHREVRHVGCRADLLVVLLEARTQVRAAAEVLLLRAALLTPPATTRLRVAGKVQNAGLPGTGSGRGRCQPGRRVKSVALEDGHPGDDAAGFRRGERRMRCEVGAGALAGLLQPRARLQPDGRHTGFAPCWGAVLAGLDDGERGFGNL